MDFRDYIGVLRRRWPLVVAITLLGVAAALAFLTVAPRSYVAASVILVSAQGAESVGDLQQGNTFSQDAARTYAEVAKSPAVLGPVVERLGLDDSAEELAEKLNITVTTDTSVFQITATEPDAETAAQVANAVAESTIETVTGIVSSDTVNGTPLVQLTQIQTASVPEEAQSPRPRTVIALGLLLGIVLGFAITLVSAALDTRIQNGGELGTITDRPILARIPTHRRGKKHPLIVREHPDGRSGEAFRTLRTNLRFLESSSARSVLVTSPRASDGKSSVAVNLAWSLAEADFSVVVVDIDLRSPRVGSYLSVSDEGGLSDGLAGELSLESAVRPTVHRSLSVVVAGSKRPNPSELLGSAELERIIRTLEERFDYVIIASPSVLASSGASVVSVVAAGTILTVAAGRTRRDELRSALLTLANVGVSPLGLVLNRAHLTAADGRTGAGVGGHAISLRRSSAQPAAPSIRNAP